MGSQGDFFEEQDTEEPVFTNKELSWVDDTLLDLKLEHSTASVNDINPAGSTSQICSEYPANLR